MDLFYYNRMIDFRFGSGVGAHHVIVDFHERGNVILMDNTYYIVVLLWI